MAKKPQMMALAKQMGPDAADDPSLLHPLFARLPPLHADTPEETASLKRDRHGPRDEQDPNPYEPIPLSQCFALADDLMERFPWDGAIIRGEEIMGQGSVLSTYTTEAEAGLEGAKESIDRDVVRDASESEDEEEEPPQRRKVRRRNPLGTAVAVGVVLVGIGIAVYGWKAGGRQASWVRWWAAVLGRRGGLDGLGSRVQVLLHRLAPVGWLG